MHPTNVSNPPKVRQVDRIQNTYHYFAGSAILWLNKLRHEIQGYKSPRGFDISQTERGIDYDLRVANRYLEYLRRYKGDTLPLSTLNVLELGPGADLGLGLYLLMKGVNSYHSLDVHNLVSRVPQEFYDRLFLRFESLEASPELIHELREQLSLTEEGKNDRLDYLCRKDFDISVFKNDEINCVVSNAAFEHFDSPQKTIAQVSEIVESGAIFYALIDLKTHTRWIRDVDPLNIYRYRDWYYNMLKFRGSPNRARFADYRNALAQNGWKNIEVIPIEVLDKTYVDSVQHRLAPKFRNSKYDMSHLSIIVLAEKI
ncbi:MAG: methyltransferase domain-containing protein [Bacteroidota bacterium]